MSTLGPGGLWRWGVIHPGQSEYDAPMTRSTLLVLSALLATLTVGCLSDFPPPVQVQAHMDAIPLSPPIDLGPRTDERDRGPAEIEAGPDVLPVDPGPTPEASCDGADDDEDGVIDEGFDLGDLCVAGVGACLAMGQLVCGDDGDSQCDAVAGAPSEELCNGRDDDCDGTADEALGVGEACMSGRGVCAVAGTAVCEDDAVVCDAAPGPTQNSRCDGEDDDCDGTVDESFLLGNACDVGVGRCQAPGRVGCLEDGTASCFGTPGDPADERCNGEDDDCDGVADEGFGTGTVCDVGVGICRRQGVTVCAGGGEATTCSAQAGEPAVDTCNGQDDDCDGASDEEFDDLGQACVAGVGECASPGIFICAENAVALQCFVVPEVVGEPQAETCDGLDEDCDGRVDEGDVCGAYAARNCRVWLGFTSQGNAVNFEDRPDWGDCPQSADDTRGTYRCTSTRGDDAFRRLTLIGDVNSDDFMSVAFTCADAVAPEVARWIEGHCAVYLGNADNNADDGMDGVATWGPCPAQRGVDPNDDQFRCTHSNFDGRFHGMPLRGDVDDNDGFAIAFRCVDDDAPERAAGLAAAVEVFLGWAESVGWLGNDPLEWGDCPAQLTDNDGRVRCVSSRGSQQFHRFDIRDWSDVDGFDLFSIMFRVRPAAP